MGSAEALAGCAAGMSACWGGAVEGTFGGGWDHGGFWDRGGFWTVMVTFNFYDGRSLWRSVPMGIGGAQPGNVSLRWMRFGSPWRIETTFISKVEGGEVVRTLDVTLAPHKPVFLVVFPFF